MNKWSTVRRVDSLGRIVIPLDMRKMLNMESGQEIELVVSGETVVLRRFQPKCIFCGSYDKIFLFEGKNVCAQCRKRLSKGI